MNIKEHGKGIQMTGKLHHLELCPESSRGDMVIFKLPGIVKFELMKQIAFLRRNLEVL